MSKKRKIPGTFSGKQYEHDGSLTYQVKDPSGKVYTYWNVDPAGNRATRRAWLRPR